MFLVLLLFFAALALEGIGTYISVIGLSAAFAADPIILTMSVVLDFCKIIAVSTLSKRWTQLNLAIRSYLVAATIVLMVITSSGIAGYLSNSFQKAMLPNQGNTIVLDNLNNEKVRLTERKKEIDVQISQLPSNNVRGRQKLMDTFKPETAHINKRLIEIDTELPTLQTKQVTQNTEVGPILFLASSLNTTAEKAVSLVIGMIIFVFDPLSIVFLITGNQLMVFRDKKKAEEKISKIEVVHEPINDKPEIVEEEHSTDWIHHDENEPPGYDATSEVEPEAEADILPEPIVEVTEEVVQESKPEPIEETDSLPVELTLPESYDPAPMSEDIILPSHDFEEAVDEEIIPSPSTEPSLEDVLKEILTQDPNRALTEEERAKIDRALDHIFPSDVHQKTPDDPEESPIEESVQEPAPLPDAVPDGTSDTAEINHGKSALHDPALDHIHGADSEFLGKHWINPKLLEIYSNTPSK